MKYIAQPDGKGKWGVWNTHTRQWMTRGFSKKKAELSAAAQNQCYKINAPTSV